MRMDRCGKGREALLTSTLYVVVSLPRVPGLRRDFLCFDLVKWSYVQVFVYAFIFFSILLYYASKMLSFISSLFIRMGETLVYCLILAGYLYSFMHPFILSQSPCLLCRVLQDQGCLYPPSKIHYCGSQRTIFSTQMEQLRNHNYTFFRSCPTQDRFWLLVWRYSAKSHCF